ncbi:ATP-binding protein [Dyella telluris]|uniref:AAA family ATPase n=1 Tax=Dyella telluris TaxID=2763498 RepID=A0A7G8Q410_9GAMM|nr:ATP-binding protein [Dyella telluris]QNK01518.1 AAA family ATPase [Dyella telluris]
MALTEEFHRFQTWLDGKQPSDDVRRVSSIIEHNLTAVAETRHAGGQRSRLLAPLLRQDWAADHTPVPTATGTTTAINWNRITELKVGPFRGFRRPEVFDIDHPVVLILGANGTGKSSLCEAIELALLGRVEEERERSVKRYLDNIHEGRHVPPQLQVNANGKNVTIRPDEELYRFIIIERNRIEGFARIGARGTAKATPLVAALFGLSEFDEFVTRFGNTLDSHLTLTRPKADQLALLKAGITEDQRKIDSVQATHQAFNQERMAIAESFESGLTYEALRARIGTSEQPGRLSEIKTALAKPLPSPTGVAVQTLIKLRREGRDLKQQVAVAHEGLAARSREISFRDLYQAVVNMEGTSPDLCPACETPLDSVTTNPFHRATQGLAALQELAALEARATAARSRAEGVWGKLIQAIETTISKAASLAPAIELPAFDPAKDTYGAADWHKLLAAARALQRQDQALALEQTRRQELESERDRLQAARTELAQVHGRQVQFDADVTEARTRLAVFEQDNAKLQEEVNTEATEHQIQVRIGEAYKGFLEALKAYREGLPEQLMADLNEVTIDIYNRFNHLDAPSDLIHALRLPLRGGDAIEVAFNGDPSRWHNALAILSEGHLRCLGMAILLAKNVKLKLPVVLLDDAVNAIDHDHREGIRNTLFGHPDLIKKQWIITCHSNEFIKDIHNNHAKGASLYVLRHHAGDHHPIVTGGSTRNYLQLATQQVDDGNARFALAHCRRALENLVTRSWKKLAEQIPAASTLALTLSRPGASPELSNVTQGLVKALNQGIASGGLVEPWVTRRDRLESILKAKPNSLAWMSLNKGTHEEADREDFEEPTVRRILGALNDLDATFP